MILRFRAWVQASRLASQSYIFLPILLGQAAWVSQGGSIDPVAFLLVQLFGLFDQLYIVYANDYADYAGDCLNTTHTMFSGGSRVLVEGLLKPMELRIAAWVMVILSIVCGAAFSVLYGRHLMTPLMCAGLLLLWMYSYRPFRCSYGGGGEILQAAGTGILLPVIGYYAQSGRIGPFPWPLVAMLLPTSLACAVATALPDEPADVQCGKRTGPVLLGTKLAKAAVIVLNIASIVAALFVSPPLQNRLTGVLFGGLPIAALLGMTITFRGDPGTPQLTLFVAMAIVVTLSLVGGAAAGLFGN